MYYSKSTFDTVFPTIIYSKSTFDTVAMPPPSCATGGGLPPAVRHPQKKHVLDFLSMYLVNLVDFGGFEALLVFFSKSGQSVQMTMPARRASKFSAQ